MPRFGLTNRRVYHYYTDLFGYERRTNRYYEYNNLKRIGTIAGSLIGGLSGAGARRFITGDSANFRQDKKRKRQFEDTATNKKKFRESSFPNIPSSTQVSMDKTANDNEVPVVPPPRVIAKTVPDYFTVRLPYVTYFTATTTTTGTTSNVFRLNDIFDPEKTSGGHQPLGRDVWAGVYNYYRVLSADVNIACWNRSSSSNGDTWVASFLTDDDTALPDNMNSKCEAKRSQYRLLNPKGTGIDRNSFEFKYDTANWDYHVTEESSDTRWTAIGASPTVAHLLVLQSGAINASTSTDIMVWLDIQFVVQFREANTTIMLNMD